MSSHNYQAESYQTEIAAFIRAKGVTRCPTACVAPTHASGSAADRAVLRLRAQRLEELREERQERARHARAGVAAAA